MAEQQAKGKKILVLDDEPHVATYLETLLSDNGYETVSASNGKEGMEIVQSDDIDLVCLDMSMPEQSGVRFYRNLKEDDKFSKIPVVIVTAVTGYGGDPDSFKKFISTRSQVPPPESFFSKPIDREDFLKTVAKILEV